MLWLLVIFFSSFLSLFVSQYSLSFIKSPGVKYFALVAFFESLLSFLLMVEAVMPELRVKLYLDIIQLLFTAVTAVCGFMFVWLFIGKKIRNEVLMLLLLFIIPALTIGLFYYDSFHNSAVAAMSLIDSGGLAELYYPYKSYHYFLFVYLGILLFLTIVIYGFNNFHYRDRASFKHSLVMTGLLFPMIFIIFSFTGQTIGPLRDSSPVFYAAGNLFILVGLMRYQIFNILPHVKNQMFEEAEVGIAVCNEDSIVFESNMLFQQLFPAINKKEQSLLTSVLPLNQELDELYHSEQKSLDRVKQIDGPDGPLWVNFTLKKILFNENTQVRGILVTAKDMTMMVSQKIAMEKKQEELEQVNSNLSSTLENLQNAQSQLINAEKMAALGQLMAGIAHELNTPIGAIQSSSMNLENSLNTLLENYSGFIKDLTEADYEKFHSLVSDLRHNNTELDFKTARIMKKSLVAKLENAGIKSSLRVATQIIDRGLYDNQKEIDYFIKKNSLETVLDYVGYLNNIITGSRVIHVGTEKVKKIVSALSTYSRSNNDISREVDICNSLETTLTLFYNSFKKGVKLEKDFCCGVKINAYENELGQIWINLLQNAIHAVEGKGTIRITTSYHDDAVIIRFEDDGCGIPAEIHTKVFEPFFTSKPVGLGTGLGLDICRRIARQHKGDITFTSEPGHTVFTVSLKGI